jgi:hypothetical protein
MEIGVVVLDTAVDKEFSNTFIHQANAAAWEV